MYSSRRRAVPHPGVAPVLITDLFDISEAAVHELLAFDHPDRVVHADALDATSYEDLPPVGCWFTPPPYMTEMMDADPLANYTETGRDDERYLAALGRVFAHVSGLLREDGQVFVDAPNMTTEATVTALRVGRRK